MIMMTVDWIVLSIKQTVTYTTRSGEYHRDGIPWEKSAFSIYGITPMYYTEIFSAVKPETFIGKNRKFLIFLFKRYIVGTR